MEHVDLNLLVALDALLAESSVAGAARRLELSSSAMSRTLKRLRLVTGDPLLVRAGRGLVPTPYAATLRDQVHEMVRDAQVVLGPHVDQFDLASLQRTFVIRANESFVESFSVPLLKAMAEAAPHVCMCFVLKPNKDAEPLREGVIDLEIGIAGTPAPEICMQPLFRDRFVGVVRQGHALLADPGVTPGRYAACKHVVTSRKGSPAGPVDDALAARGLQREVTAVVPGFSSALQIARHSDRVALVPRSCLGHASTLGLQVFELPVSTPELTISVLWHPRMDADPAHRWLRDVVTSVCAAVCASAS